jgi:hypothetical protein
MGEGHYYASQASFVLRYLRTSQLMEELLFVSDVQTFCWRVIGDRTSGRPSWSAAKKNLNIQYSIIDHYSTDSIHKLFGIARVGTESPFHPYHRND